MGKTSKLKNNNCRTCLNGSKGLQSLTKMATEDQTTQKSYAELIKEITNINIMDETFNEMPQSICACCIRKLIAAHEYVEQAKEANDKLWSMLCDDDTGKKIDRLQEAQIVIQNSFEIKMEYEIGDDDNNKDELPKCEVKLKLEDPEEGGPSIIHLNKFSTNENEHTKEALPIKDELETSSNPDIKLSDSEDNDEDDIFDADFPKPNKDISDSEDDWQEEDTKPLGKKEVKTKSQRSKSKKHRKLPRKYDCEQCEGSYTNKYYLLAHIKSKHNPDESAPKKSERVMLPKKRFECTLCDSIFYTQTNLDIHIRQHTGEKPLTCDLCDRVFYRPSDMQAHRRFHTGERPFKCTICEKAFPRSNDLKTHKRKHSNERPYKCAQCQKAFKHSKDLNIHKRVHTGERPYQCSVCQSTFTQSNSLKLHQTKQQHFVYKDRLLNS